ncbi:hypothetical protein ACLJCJ_09340 [Campylobacter coli]|uniref:hypothetical protein n=2 Tax=Campylobacter coli TaxID=195 RepID=UPI003F7CA483
MIPALIGPTAVFQPFISAPFWTSAGGATDINFGVAPPLFNGDITLRGGFARIFIGAYPENVPLRVRVWAIWAQPRPSNTLYTGINNSNQPVEWDPSIFPDFTTQFGKILYQKEAIVPVGESFNMVHRFKPQKIDTPRFVGAAGQPSGSSLWWLVSCANLDTNLLSAQITVVTSHNLSFSADAIGTT